MRRHSLTLASALAAACMVWSCTTIPKDAPDEFQAAQASIDKAKAEDADTFLPKTMRRAQKTMNDALDLYDRARAVGTEAAMRSAREKAAQAGRMAENARSVTSDVKTWDGDITQYLALKDSVRELHALRGRRVPRTVATDIAVRHFSMSTPVAFFPRGRADLLTGGGAAVKELASLLKANKGLYVKVTGFADHRGSPAMNAELSKLRAENVATLLENAGVEQDRIDVTYKGETQAKSKVSAKEEGKMQLDRRVEVTVTTVAH